MQVRSWGQEDPLGEETAPDSRILAGKSHGQRSLVIQLGTQHRVLLASMTLMKEMKFREVNTSKGTDLVCNRARGRQWKAVAEL